VPWIAVDLLLVLVALVLLAACGLRLWSGVKRLGREVGAAGTAVGAATDALAAVSAPPPATGPGARLNVG
jgi:hypothetical protein